MRPTSHWLSRGIEGALGPVTFCNRFYKIDLFDRFADIQKSKQIFEAQSGPDNNHNYLSAELLTAPDPLQVCKQRNDNLRIN